MPDNLLLFLQTVIETGSITQAAHELYVTQPYISHIIKDAEKKYNVKLLDRSQHPLTLTFAGKRLITYLQQVKRLEAGLQHEMEDLSDNEFEYLTICTNSSIGHDWYVKILKQLYAHHPNLILKTLELPFQEGEKQLKSGLVDILLDKEINSKSFHFEEIKDFPVVLIIPNTSPLYQPDITWRSMDQFNLSDLNNQPFITVGDISSFQQMINAKLTSQNIAVTRILQVPNLQAATQLSLEKIGLTLVPELTLHTVKANNLIKNVNIIPIPPKAMHFSFGINITRHQANNPVIQDLITILKKQFIK